MLTGTWSGGRGGPGRVESPMPAGHRCCPRSWSLESVSAEIWWPPTFCFYSHLAACPGGPALGCPHCPPPPPAPQGFQLSQKEPRTHSPARRPPDQGASCSTEEGSPTPPGAEAQRGLPAHWRTTQKDCIAETPLGSGWVGWGPGWEEGTVPVRTTPCIQYPLCRDEHKDPVLGLELSVSLYWGPTGNKMHFVVTIAPVRGCAWAVYFSGARSWVGTC